MESDQNLNPQPVQSSIQPEHPQPPKQKTKYPFLVGGLILFLILVGIASAAFLFVNKNAEKTVCTMEAKICPDGSSVGRTGPKCEFAPCPSASPPQGKPTIETSNWKTYTNTKYGFSLEYPENVFRIQETANLVRWRYEDNPYTGWGDFMLLRWQNTPFQEVVIGNKFAIYFQKEDGTVKVDQQIRDVKEIKDIKINGEKANSYLLYCGIGGGTISECYYRLVHFDVNGVYYEWLMDQSGGGLYNRGEKILSTFKFTDSNPTPTCMERPACLDTEPRCLIPEPANGWCP